MNFNTNIGSDYVPDMQFQGGETPILSDGSLQGGYGYGGGGGMYPGGGGNVPPPLPPQLQAIETKNTSNNMSFKPMYNPNDVWEQINREKSQQQQQQQLMMQQQQQQMMYQQPQMQQQQYQQVSPQQMLMQHYYEQPQMQMQYEQAPALPPPSRSKKSSPTFEDLFHFKLHIFIAIFFLIVICNNSFIYAFQRSLIPLPVSMRTSHPPLVFVIMNAVFICLLLLLIAYWS